MGPDGRLLWQIFLSFLKLGPVTFGGGYAIIPLIEQEVVSRRKWVRAEDITDVLAVSQSVPGAIAINSATFIGYRIAGVKGAIAAMAGVLLPTFLIVIGLSISFLYFKDHPKIEAAFEGIRPAIVALIAFAGYKISKTAVFDKTTLALVVVTVLLLLVVHLHPVLIIVCGAAVGILLVKIKDKLGYTIKLDHHQDKEHFDTDYFMGAGI